MNTQLISISADPLDTFQQRVEEACEIRHIAGYQLRAMTTVGTATAVFLVFQTPVPNPEPA